MAIRKWGVSSKVTREGKKKKRKLTGLAHVRKNESPVRKYQPSQRKQYNFEKKKEE